MCSQPCDTSACPGNDPCITAGGKKICKPSSGPAAYGESCSATTCTSGLCLDLGGGKKLCSQECDKAACPNNDPCVAAGSKKVCKPRDKNCTPKSCTSLGKKCGSWDDGCGGKVPCGNCAKGTICLEKGTCGCSDCVTSGEYAISDMGKNYSTIYKDLSFQASLATKFGTNTAKDIVDRAYYVYASTVRSCCCSSWKLKEGERGMLMGEVSYGTKTIMVIKLQLCNDHTYAMLAPAGVQKGKSCKGDSDCPANFLCELGWCRSKCKLTCNKTAFTYSCASTIKKTTKKMCVPSKWGPEDLTVEYTNGHKVTCKFYCEVAGGKCWDDGGVTCNQ